MAEIIAVLCSDLEFRYLSFHISGIWNMLKNLMIPLTKTKTWEDTRFCAHLNIAQIRIFGNSLKYRKLMVFERLSSKIGIHFLTFFCWICSLIPSHKNGHARLCVSTIVQKLQLKKLILFSDFHDFQGFLSEFWKIRI